MCECQWTNKGSLSAVKLSVLTAPHFNVWVRINCGTILFRQQGNDGAPSGWGREGATDKVEPC